jgi:hypothetical protein
MDEENDRDVIINRLLRYPDVAYKTRQQQEVLISSYCIICSRLGIKNTDTYVDNRNGSKMIDEMSF